MPPRALPPVLLALLLPLLPLSVVSAQAQDEAGAAPAAAPVALRAAQMLDVESGRMIANPVVVVRNGIIESAGPGAPPAGMPVIDLGDLTLLPGLIDAHVHLTDDIEGDWTRRPVTDGPADAALRGARNARRTVEAGFTTVRDVGAGNFVNVALGRAADQGLIAGPRVIAAGHSLGITGGHCDVTGFAPGILEQDWRHGVADGADEVRKAVRYQTKHGAKVIKICATAGVLSFEGPVGVQQFTEDEMRAAVEEAARHGIKVAAHAHGTEGIKAAVRAGVASIEHGSVLDDEAIRMMKERGTYLVPTSYLADAIDMEALPPTIRAKAESVIPQMRVSLAKAIRAGVPIAFGTDAAVFPHGDNAREFAVYVQQGMTPLEAIRSATTSAATLLGTPDRGTIAAGKLADLIAVRGNPLDNVRVLEDVVFVMRGGEIIKAPPGSGAPARR